MTLTEVSRDGECAGVESGLRMVAGAAHSIEVAVTGPSATPCNRT